MKSVGAIWWHPDRGHLTISSSLIRALSYPAELRAVRRADGLMLGENLQADDAVVLQVRSPGPENDYEFSAPVSVEAAAALQLQCSYAAWRDLVDDVLYAVPEPNPMQLGDLAQVDLTIQRADLRELEAFALRHGRRAREVIALFVATLAENARADLEEMDLTPAEREAVERSAGVRSRAKIAELPNLTEKEL